MQKKLWMIAAIACGYAGYLFWDQNQTMPLERAAEPAVDVTAATSLPAPTAGDPTSPAPTAPASKLKPGLFLARAHSISTHSGIIGKRAGTRVKLLEKKGRINVVTDGADTFEIEAVALTTDENAALALLERETAGKAARQRQTQAANLALQRQQVATSGQMEADRAARLKAQSSQEKDALRRQIAAAQSKVQQLHSRAAEADRKQSEARLYGKRASHNAGASDLRDEANALEQRIQQWQMQVTH